MRFQRLSGFLEKIPRSQQILLLSVLVMSLTVLVGITAIYTPWRERRHLLEGRYREEEQRTHLLSVLHQQEGQISKQEKTFLFTGGGTPALTREVTRLASKNGVAIESVIPQNEVPFGPYKKFQVRILATSTFPDLLNFIRALEKYRPLLKIDQLELGGGPQQKGNTLPRLLEKTFLEGTTTAPLNQERAKLLISAFSQGESSP